MHNTLIKRLFFSIILLISSINIYADDIFIDPIYYRILSPTTVEAAYLDYCSNNLAFIEIPESITVEGNVYRVISIRESFGENAIYSLKEIKIPSSIERIGKQAFLNCYYLQFLRISDGVKTIGDGAFAFCGMNSVTLPKSLEDLGAEAFKQNYLKTITLSDCLKKIKYATFKNSQLLRKVVIPDGIESIAENAFDGCNLLQTVVLGKKVKRIGNSAFGHCPQLMDCYLQSSTPPVIDNLVEQTGYEKSKSFDENRLSKMNVWVPKGCKNVYKENEYWKNFKRIYEYDPDTLSLINHPDYQSSIVGKWELTSRNGNVHTHVEFKSDNTFSYTSAEKASYEEHGTYKIENSWLYQKFSDEDDWCKNKIQLLNPMSLIMQEYDGNNPKGKPDVYINTNPTPSTGIDKNLIGKWKLTTEDGYKHTHLELNEDGTFLYTSVDNPKYNEYGIYRVEGNIMYQKFSDEDDWCMDLILLNNPMSLALQEYNGIEVDDEIAGYIKENPEPPTETNPLLIGKWEITAQNGYKHTHVEFKSDGTFSYTSASDETYEEHGIFRIEDDILYQMFSDEGDWELSKIISLDGENLSLVELKNDGVNSYDEVDKYKKVSTNINSVTSRSEIQNVYSIEGIKIEELRKGINIVKMKDGTTKKVLVK